MNQSEKNYLHRKFNWFIGRFRMALTVSLLTLIAFSYNNCVVSDLTSKITGAKDNDRNVIGNTNNDNLNLADPFDPPAGLSKIEDGTLAKGFRLVEFTFPSAIQEEGGIPVYGPVDASNTPRRIALYSGSQGRLELNGELIDFTFEVGNEFTLIGEELGCDNGSTATLTTASIFITLPDGRSLAGGFERHEGVCIPFEGVASVNPRACFVLRGDELNPGEEPEGGQFDEVEFQYEFGPGGCDDIGLTLEDRAQFQAL